MNKFAIAVLDPKHKTFVIYVTALSINLNNEMQPLKKAWIVYLKANKVLTKVFCEYIDFAEVFLSKLVAKLSEYIRINNHAIELVND